MNEVEDWDDENKKLEHNMEHFFFFISLITDIWW